MGLKTVSFLCRRLFFFFAINLLIVLTLSFLLTLLGFVPYLRKTGFGLTGIGLCCLIWGMGGALISLALSRKMARRLMRVQTIESDKTFPAYIEIVKMVERLSFHAGLPTVPEVGVFQSPEMNAFATGPSKKRAMVAVSTGLIENMDRSEIEAVLAHEISHIANGDMVTMALTQGIVNAFVMFISNILFYTLCVAVQRDNSVSKTALRLVTFLFELLFMALGCMVVSAFSRHREFRADLGGAALSSKEKMIGALQRLQENKQYKKLQKRGSSALNAMMISRPQKSILFSLFSTHPSLDRRIERLKQQG